MIDGGTDDLAADWKALDLAARLNNKLNDEFRTQRTPIELQRTALRYLRDWINSGLEKLDADNRDGGEVDQQRREERPQVV